MIMLVAAVLVSGCERKQPARNSSDSQPEEPKSQDSPTAEGTNRQPGIRIHWAGAKRVLAETNAPALRTVLKLPETARLASETLDKLATAPWRIWKGEPGTNTASRLLRPLLDDVLREECYFEAKGSGLSNRLPTFFFAIRLNAERSLAWGDSLATVCESLMGGRKSAATGRLWVIHSQNAPAQLELAREGDWTVLAFGEKQDRLLEQCLDRIRTTRLPAPTDTNWFAADFDSSVLRTWGIRVPKELSRAVIAFYGEPENVRTKGEIFLSEPLIGGLPDWNIPTNLIDGNFVSFAAVRGIAPLLKRSGLWEAEFGPAPDQLCAWSSPGTPVQSYLAAPLTDATNPISRISDRILQIQSSLFPDREVAEFVRSQDYPGLEWRGFPFLSPTLRGFNSEMGWFGVAGTFPHTVPVQPLPPELLGFLSSRSNLLAYGWEQTGSRIEQWLFTGQFIRIVLAKVQLPAGSAQLIWLKETASTLGPTASELTLTSATRVAFSRNSSLGFASAELHLLADWLASPHFPWGTHTSLPSEEIRQ